MVLTIQQINQPTNPQPTNQPTCLPAYLATYLPTNQASKQASDQLFSMQGALPYAASPETIKSPDAVNVPADDFNF